MGTKFKSFRLSLGILTVGVLAGCATGHRGPHLSRIEAVQLADAEVRRMRDLKGLWPGKAHYSPPNDLWRVTYIDKRSGGGFEVEVNDRTKKARLATFIDV